MSDKKIEKKIEKIFSKPDLKDARKRGKNDTLKIEYHASDKFSGIGTGKKYHIITYGCQMNEHDSEAMVGILEELGYEKALDVENSDLILFNTCAVRAGAENKVFGEIGRLKPLKINNPNLILGVCGCMPQEESVVEEILTKYPHIDLVFGTHNIYKLPEYLHNCFFEKNRVIEVFSQEGNIVENLPRTRKGNIKAYVNIMFGCDEFCTYCIVPYTRGKERSRKPEDILKEIADLAAEGFKEVTLLGQNVNAYGKDFIDREYSFAELLTDISKVDIPRVRFTTSHPRDLDSKTIDVMAKGGNIMPQLHLPVQSGSTEVLKKMNRKYTREKYLDLINELKEKIPHIVLGTDIIVGFPNETESQFEETLSLVREVGYEMAFTFVYSKRDGTAAAKMIDTVSETDKKKRLYKLNDTFNKQLFEKNQVYIDKVVNVLVEGTSKSNDKILSGYTEGFKLVNFEGDKSLIGQIVPVKITSVKTFYLFGEAV